MLDLQIMYTGDTTTDITLEEHFRGNLLQIIKSCLLGETGLDLDEIVNAADYELEQIRSKFFPKDSDELDVAEIMDSVIKVIESPEIISANIIQEYIIYKMYQMYCQAAQGSGANMVIPFLRRCELLTSYRELIKAEEYGWSDAEVDEYAENLVKQIEDIHEWMEILFDDMDYLLLDDITLEELVENGEVLGIRP